MLLHEVTLDPQVFAEENHCIIDRFLRSKRLPRNDYYDVVVFGYLRAVRQYCSRADLREKYDFGAIAWRKMLDDLYKHFKAQSLPSRKAATVSLEDRICGNEAFTRAEIIGGADRALESLDARLLWEDISCRLSEEQIGMLRMRADGYTDREIAVRQKCRLCDIKTVFAGIQAAVSGLYPV